MNSAMEKTGLQLRSLVKKSGELELSLVSVPMPVPQADEVVVRIEGSPINPSDLGLPFGAADMSAARRSGSAALPVITASIPDALMKGIPTCVRSSALIRSAIPALYGRAGRAT